MIETVVSVDLMVEEELKVKKNHLAPDFPTGEEKRICIVSGLYGDELQGQYICYEVIRRIKLEYENLTGYGRTDIKRRCSKRRNDQCRRKRACVWCKKGRQFISGRHP